MANNKKIAQNCNPPHDCFNCPYDECINNYPRTKTEAEFVRIAGLATHGRDKNFPLAKDLVHRVRSGWLV